MLPWLSPKHLRFPDIRTALKDPEGLLAAGGDLAPERILAAYRQGIFPWFSPGDPILWWSPDPRTVFFPQTHHISKSLRKTLRKNVYQVSFDRCFSDVMNACAEPRSYAKGTWICKEMIDSYTELHRRGFGHSVEVWQGDRLVGGLYGLAIGRMFFGESMFSRADNASKVGFAYLVRQLMRWDFQLIDCQVANPHLFSLGAEEIPREEFRNLLVHFTEMPGAYPLHWSEVSIDPWE